jgi:hypothetical protein
MKILFIPTKNPKLQGDLLEVCVLNGLRNIIGDQCIDIPRKKVMYHDWSDTKREELHGRGFTLYTHPIVDIKNRNTDSIDVILYGDGHIYGESDDLELNKLCNNIWHLDGHDLYGSAPKKIIFENEEIIATQFEKCFKRELVEEGLRNVFPTGFGIPSYHIKPINLENKAQLYQKTVPDAALFKPVHDLGSRNHHKFTVEEDYYQDLQTSWFGLTCKKGGWDCLRHYEILMTGTLLLFRDYNKKPKFCSPQNLPCFSYSSKEELDELINRLLINGKPTNEYKEMLFEQRKWLYNTGTTEARAINILNILKENI